MNTFSLGRADDNILDGSSGFQDEDGIFLAGLGLALAVARAALPVEFLHATIESTLDNRSSGKGAVTAGSGKFGCETRRSGSSAAGLTIRKCQRESLLHGSTSLTVVVVFVVVVVLVDVVLVLVVVLVVVVLVVLCC